MIQSYFKFLLTSLLHKPFFFNLMSYRQTEQKGKKQALGHCVLCWSSSSATGCSAAQGCRCTHCHSKAATPVLLCIWKHTQWKNTHKKYIACQFSWVRWTTNIQPEGAKGQRIALYWCCHQWLPIFIQLWVWNHPLLAVILGIFTFFSELNSSQENMIF